MARPWCSRAGATSGIECRPPAATPYPGRMAAKIIDGKRIVADVWAEVAARVRRLADHGVTPGLSFVLVGDDPASKIYVGAKQKASAEVGMRSERIDLPAKISQAELLGEIERLNADPGVHGYLVQLPLPPHLDVLAVHQAM